MDIYGSLKEIVSVILRKSGFLVTVSAPTNTAKDYSYKLPDTNANSSATLVTEDHAQTLSNKTLTAPVITNFSNAQHDHSASGVGGQLIDTAIATNAAIRRSKLASDTASAVLINDGSGVMSSEAQLAKSRGGFGTDISALVPGITMAKKYLVDGSIAASNSGLKLFKTITEAIAAATGAGASYAGSPIVIEIAPSSLAFPYVEDIKLYDGIVLRGQTPATTIIRGKITVDTGLLTYGKAALMQNLDFYHYPTASGVSFDLTGAVSTNLCSFNCLPSANTPVTGVKISPASTQTVIHGLMSVLFYPQVSYTSDAVPCEVNGAGSVSIYQSGVQILSNQSAGLLCVIEESGIGAREYFGNFIQASMSNAAYSGTVRGYCTTTKSSGTRLAQNCQIRLEGSGSGTAYGVYLVSSTHDAEFFHAGEVVFINGFTPGSEYLSYTGTGDVHKIWLNSVNKDLGKDGPGLSVVTPYDEQKSGFVAWASSGTYWTTSGTTLSVAIAGVGCVKDSPVKWVAGNVTLTPYSTNYVYATATGALGSTTTVDDALYTNNIVLFEAYYDGTNYLIAKENHPYKFTSAVGSAWHKILGALLIGTGAVLTNVNTLPDSARVIKIVGADTLEDHGLETIIPDSAGSAVSLIQTYTDASSRLKLGSPATAIPSKYNNAGTLTNCANNHYCVVRIGAIKDNLNSALPQYIAHVDTTDYNNLSAARTAVSANSVAIFPPELQKLEVVQLGFAILKGDGAGAGTLQEITVSKQVFGANFSSSAASTSAALSNTNVTNFDKILSSSDTTVQLALDTIDERAVPRVTGTAANMIPLFSDASGTLKTSVATLDASGNLNLSSSGSVTVGTITEAVAGSGVAIGGSLLVSGTHRASSTGANILPKGTTAQRPSGAAVSQGMVRFNTDSGNIEIFDSAWKTAGAATNNIRVTQSETGLSLGMPVYDNGTLFVAANASGGVTAEVVAMVTATGTGYIDVTTNGLIQAIPAARVSGTPTKGTVLFLDSTSGVLTITEPVITGYISKPLGIVTAVNAGPTYDIYFYNMRGTTVGGTNLYTTIPLNNGTATSLQTVNVAAGEGGFIEGVIKIAATVNTTTTFKVEFARPLTGTAYTCTPQYGCDALPAGSSIDITSGGVIQLTLPSISGFSSGSARFSMQAANVGAQLPLNISITNVSTNTSGVASASGVLGEVITQSITNTSVTTSISAQRTLTLGAGVWAIYFNANFNTSPTVTGAVIGISTSNTSYSSSNADSKGFLTGGSSLGFLGRSIGPVIANISGNTTYYGVAQTQGANATNGCDFTLTAVRIG